MFIVLLTDYQLVKPENHETLKKRDSCLFFQGEFPYEVLTGGLVATIILKVIKVFKQNAKKIIFLKQMNESFTMFSFFLHTHHIFP